MSILDRFFKGKKRRRHRAVEPPAKEPRDEAPAAGADGAGEAPAGAGEAPAQTPADTRSAEERCGITPDMDEAAIREQLAKMFRRYNRLASSLDGGSRAEAEAMLDAIVALREKYLG